MQTRNFKKVLLASFTILFILMSCASPDEKANKLYVQAVKLIESAQKVEDTSYRHALKLYKEALSKLQRIISKYPSSQIAVKIVSGEVKDMNNLKENIIPKISLKAAAEEDPLACAVMVASAIKRGGGDGAFLELAEKCLEVGKHDEALKMVYQFHEAFTTWDDVYGVYREDLPKGFEGFSLLCDQIRIQLRAGQRELLTLLPELPELEEELDEEKIKDPYDRAIAVIKIAELYAEAGQKNKALEVLSKAVQADKIIKYAPFRVYPLVKIATYYVELGQKEKALEILSQAMDIARSKNYIAQLALTDIAVVLHNLGKEYEALYLLSQTLEVAKSEKGLWKFLGLAKTATSYAEIGQYHLALQIAERIPAEGIVPKHTISPARHIFHTNLWKLEVLIHTALKAGESGKEDKALKILLQALDVAKSMKSSYERDLSLRQIACQLAKIGKYDKAFEILKIIERRTDKLLILGEIGVNMQKSGKKPTENQSKILHKMIAMVD